MPKGDDTARFRRGAAGRDMGEEAGDVGHRMVGGEHQDEGLRIARQREARGGGDGRAAVAAERLQHDVAGHTGRPHLLGDEEAIVLAGDDDGGVEIGAGDALQRRLEQRVGLR